MIHQLGKREILIIKHLLNSKKPLSSDLLGVVLGASPKTVRSSMDTVSEILKIAGGARLVSKTGMGYSLEIFDDEEFKVFMQSFNAKYLDAYWVPTNASVRVTYIIRRLLISEKHIKMESLVDALFVSRVTLTKDLKIVRETLKKYHIKLIHRAKYGLKIIGKEQHIRIALVDYLDVDEDSNYMDLMDTQFLYKRDPQDINDAVIVSLVNHKISISTNSLKKFVKLIIVSEYRIQKKHILRIENAELERIAQKKEYEVAQQICKNLNLIFSNEELCFMAIFIISRRHISHIESLDDPTFEALSLETLDFIQNTYSITAYNADAFRTELAKHIRGMYYRMKYGFEKRDVGILESKSSNPAFEIAVIASNYLSEAMGIEVQETEIAFLSYRFYEQFRLNAFYKKSKVVVILSNGKNASDLFIHELKANFKEFIDVADAAEFYEVPFLNLSKYDCILTDIPAIQFDVSIEIRRVNYYFTEKDLFKLENFFKRKRENYESYLQCLNPKLFFYDLDLDHKDAVLEFMEAAVCEVLKLNDDFKLLITERERLSSTERGNCVALPHTLYPVTDLPVLVVARLKKPIMWEREVCQIIIMTINGRSEKSPFLTLSLTKLLTGNIDFVYDLFRTNQYKDSLKVFKQYVETLKV